jgi:hypothetical protein
MRRGFVDINTGPGAASSSDHLYLGAIADGYSSTRASFALRGFDVMASATHFSETRCGVAHLPAAARVNAR